MEVITAEAAVPKWMNEKFFENILQFSANDKTIQVDEVLVSFVNESGENLSSYMFKASISYKINKSVSKIQSFILKTTFPVGDTTVENTNPSQFEIETVMFYEILPEMERAFKIVQGTFTFSPRLLYQSQWPHPIIVLEDLTTKGFQPVKKLANLELSLLVFARLAQFHATSLHLYENKGNVPDYKTTFNTSKNKFRLDSLLKEKINIFLTELKSWGPEYQVYCEKFDKIKNNLKEILDKVYSKNEDDDGYNVLIHGNFGIKNMLVKWDEQENKKAKDLVFLNFQNCFWGSPALDIIYGLYNMIDNEVRVQHRHELMTHYYNEFTATLKKIGYLGKVPTLVDLNVEMLRKGSFEMILMVFFLPFQNTDFTNLNLQKKSEMESKCYQSPDYHTVLRTELPRFLNKGFIN